MILPLNYPVYLLLMAKPRAEWLQELYKDGVCWSAVRQRSIAKGSTRSRLRVVVQQQRRVKRTLVKTPLENSPAAGIFTLKKALPTGCTVNAVICTVAELVGSFKGKSYCASTVQLFTPSQGGFSQQFLYDSPKSPLLSHGSDAFGILALNPKSP